MKNIEPDPLYEDVIKAVKTLIEYQKKQGNAVFTLDWIMDGYYLVIGNDSDRDDLADLVSETFYICCDAYKDKHPTLRLVQ